MNCRILTRFNKKHISDKAQRNAPSFQKYSDGKMFFKAFYSAYLYNLPL